MTQVDAMPAHIHAQYSCYPYSEYDVCMSIMMFEHKQPNIPKWTGVLSADSSLKLQLTQVALASFWILAASQYPSLSKQAIKFLLLFTTTYLCESGVSIVTVIKSKTRNKLKATWNATLRVSPSLIPQQPDVIVSQKQAQVSHWG